MFSLVIIVMCVVAFQLLCRLCLSPLSLSLFLFLPSAFPPPPLTMSAASTDVSFPKNKIKVLLLERISQAAQQIFINEGYQARARGTYDAALCCPERRRRSCFVLTMSFAWDRRCMCLR